MKKFITTLLTFLIVSAMVLSVSATESENIKYDSIIIPEDIKTELGVCESDQIIAMYNVSLIEAFTTCNNIDEVLSSDHVLEIRYKITSTDGSVTWKAKRQGVYGELSTLTLIPEDPRATSAFETSEVLELLPEDTQIENVYYLFSVPHHEGTALYYVTNHGDYIYHFDSPSGFYTLKEFCDYQKAIFDKLAAMNPELIGLYGGAETADSSATGAEGENSTNIYLWVGIPCAAVLVIAGVMLGIKKKRKG